MLYFGASRHMCLRRNWFSFYQSINNDVVFMEKYFSCKIVGIGSIKVKMYDSTMRILIEVRNVLKLRKNLISMGVLYSYAYKFKVQGRVLKVSKGILVVVKPKMIENLYKVEGSTEINQSVVLSEVASESSHL